MPRRTLVELTHKKPMAKQYVLKTLSGDLSARLGNTLGGNFWRWDTEPEKAFTVKSPLRKGAVITRSGITTPPDVLEVINLATGEERTLLVGKVLLSTLTENFPNDTYVGRSFRCVQGPVPAGQRYKSMTVQEIFLDGAAEDSTPEPAAQPAKGKSNSKR